MNLEKKSMAAYLQRKKLLDGKRTSLRKHLSHILNLKCKLILQSNKVQYTKMYME